MDDIPTQYEIDAIVDQAARDILQQLVPRVALTGLPPEMVAALICGEVLAFYAERLAPHVDAEADELAGQMYALAQSETFRCLAGKPTVH